MCNEVSYSVNEYERGKIYVVCGSVPDPTYIYSLRPHGRSD